MKLSDWLSTANTTHARFGESIGVTRETVTRWATGAVIPDWDMIIKIEDVTQRAVTALDWAAAKRERV